MQLVALSGSLTILPPGDIFPLMQVSVDDAKDPAKICAQTLALTGTYTLQVKVVTAPGSYTVRIERLGSPTDEPLSDVTETITMDPSTLTVARPPLCQAE